TIRPGDRVLLIIEDDIDFARVLLDKGRECGFKAVIAPRASHALSLAREFEPAAITLDLRLPDQNGWTVLDRLKHDPATRHIPVHIISVEGQQQRTIKLGALTYVQKPGSNQALEKSLYTIREFVELLV